MNYLFVIAYFQGRTKLTVWFSSFFLGIFYIVLCWISFCSASCTFHPSSYSLLWKVELKGTHQQGFQLSLDLVHGVAGDQSEGEKSGWGIYSLGCFLEVPQSCICRLLLFSKCVPNLEQLENILQMFYDYPAWSWEPFSLLVICIGLEVVNTLLVALNLSSVPLVKSPLVNKLSLRDTNLTVPSSWPCNLNDRASYCDFVLKLFFLSAELNFHKSKHNLQI